MKTFLKRILIAVGLTLGANAMLGATLANDSAEQYFKAKVGRNTPAATGGRTPHGAQIAG